MSDYIGTPLSHPKWDPSKGDFYSASVVADDKHHEKRVNRKNLLIGSLISIHLILLISVIVFFS